VNSSYTERTPCDIIINQKRYNYLLLGFINFQLSQLHTPCMVNKYVTVFLIASFYDHLVSKDDVFSNQLVHSFWIAETTACSPIWPLRLTRHPLPNLYKGLESHYRILTMNMPKLWKIFNSQVGLLRKL
jgi:hypothetical protein